MAEIKAFKGIRYNPDKISNFTQVVAPPYDVINVAEQDGFYKKDPFNVIRLILSKGEGDKKYSDASNTFNDWLKNNILIQDDTPSIYPYYQEFEFEGEKYKRKGFIAAVKNEDFESRTILPHEQTFKKHKEDRLKLTTACNANLSQVFCVYSDREGKVEKLIDDNLSAPLIDIVTDDGIKNSFWKISDPEIISNIQDTLKEKNLLIADGHHRYETSMNYRNQQREKFGENSGTKPYDYVMMYISRGEGEGLIINPTHRTVKNLGTMNEYKVMEEIGKSFTIEKIDINEALNLEFNQISIVTKIPDGIYKLTPKESKSKKYENLAIMLLHSEILNKIINEDQAEIKFSKFHDEVIEDVQNGDFKAGFLLPKLNADDIFEVVLDGVKMPHKTTYFYPKILSGLVFNPLW
ncbi:MAG: DUF1015 domain-containing protein [Thermodesulfobacteriota bacterium]